MKNQNSNAPFLGARIIALVKLLVFVQTSLDLWGDDHLQLGLQGLVSVRDADVRHVGPSDVIALGSLGEILWSQPILFELQ